MLHSIIFHTLILDRVENEHVYRPSDSWNLEITPVSCDKFFPSLSLSHSPLSNFQCQRLFTRNSILFVVYFDLAQNIAIADKLVDKAISENV